MNTVAVDPDERWWWQVSVFGTGGRRMRETRSLPALDLIPVLCQIACKVFYVPYLI